MAADDHRTWNLGDDRVAADDSRPDAVQDGDRAAPRLDPVYVRLREILHRTSAGSSGEPSPMLPGMEAY